MLWQKKFVLALMIVTLLFCLGQNGCSGGEDKQTGTVVSTNPADGSTNVATSIAISITFSAAVDVNSIEGTLAPDFDYDLGSSVDNKTITVQPSSTLTANTTYTITGISTAGLASGIYAGDGDRSTRGIRASGSSLAAGLIWPQELAAGRINHALAMGYALIASGGPVGPFTASDGQSDDPAAMPMGMRLQLNPDLDLSTLGLDPWEQTIAEALQTYGMYIVDSAGGINLAAMHVYSFEANPYDGLFPDDALINEGILLDKLPPEEFRVLQPQ